MNLYPYQKTILDAINTLPDKPNFKFFNNDIKLGKSLQMLHSVEYVLATGKILGIFTEDTLKLHDKLKEQFPKAKLTIMEGYVKVERAQ